MHSLGNRLAVVQNKLIIKIRKTVCLLLWQRNTLIFFKYLTNYPESHFKPQLVVVLVMPSGV